MAGALAGLCSAAASPASAQSAEPVHLSWVRSADALECGDAGQVQADVVRRLGRNPFREPSQVFVEALVSRLGGAFSAELELRDAQGASLGSRHVASEAESCTSLVSAAGLAIALMIDPDAVATPHVALTPPAPSPSRPAQPREATPAPRRAPMMTVFAGAVAAARVLPQPALGARLGVDLRLSPHLRGELSLSFLPEQRQSLRGVDVGFGLSYGALGLCYEPVSEARVTLAACGFAQLGAMNATAYDPARTRQGELSWSAAGAGLRAGWVLAEPVLLRVGVDGSVPLQRREYAISRSAEPELVVFRDPAFAATLLAGLGARF